MMQIENISANDIDKYLYEGALIIDVRSEVKYDKSHIKSAINIPYDFLMRRRNEIPKNRVVVVYCDRGGKSLQAARMLNAQGIAVKNVVGGIMEYRGKNIVNKTLT